MFTTKKMAFEVLVCDFCGSMHASREDAEAHGCCEGPGQPAYAIGDAVFVYFDIDGNDMGYFAEGRIIAVSKPLRSAAVEPVLKRIVDGEGLGPEYLGFETTLRVHEWMYEVRPVNPKGNILGPQWFCETDIEVEG